MAASLFACNPSSDKPSNLSTYENTTSMDAKQLPFSWNNANVYFMLTDRFKNGNPSNDQAYGRKKDGAKLRSFEGGDLQGIIQKIEDGYFDKLGISAIWFNPPVEQVHGYTDEGTGKTYAYHGYWAKDWTNIDANYGTEDDLAKLVATAHQHGIRILMDVVINHTGPVTDLDPAWSEDWVRQSPTCTYEDANSTIACTLVENLPDIKTESNEDVELPAALVEKWKKEGRYEQEVQELEAFFARTGYPKAPRFYIIKWLTDYVRKHGIDGFRVDTAKHTEASVWGELFKEATQALADWKAANPAEVLDDKPFFMTGEVYGYSIRHGKKFPMGEDEYVDFFAEGFQSLINFSLINDSKEMTMEELFSSYSEALHSGDLKGLSVLNYLSSHDDGNPFDPLRKQATESAVRLLLAPGASQVYYGDETARLLQAEGAEGDANLRSMMNWEEIDNETKRGDYTVKEILIFWQKLGIFRREHLAVGAGVHTQLAESPYTFKRVLEGEDRVIVAMDFEEAGSQEITVKGVFEDGVVLKDYFSGNTAEVSEGKVIFEATESDLLLLGKPL